MADKRDDFTPGPWVVDPDDSYSIVSEDWGGIATVPNEPAESLLLMRQARANARLIAAAPDLLEALREIAKGTGPFSRDQQEFADNVIEYSKSVATEALRKYARIAGTRAAS